LRFHNLLGCPLGNPNGRTNVNILFVERVVILLYVHVIDSAVSFVYVNLHALTLRCTLDHRIPGGRDCMVIMRVSVLQGKHVGRTLGLRVVSRVHVLASDLRQMVLSFFFLIVAHAFHLVFISKLHKILFLRFEIFVPFLVHYVDVFIRV